LRTAKEPGGTIWDHPGSMDTQDTVVSMSLSNIGTNILKSVFDRCLSLSGLIILTSALVVIAWLIKREDGGPVF